MTAAPQSTPVSGRAAHPGADPDWLARIRAHLPRRSPAVMGIVNVTPDSFSDGGDFLAPEKAVAHARALIAAGADLIDVGAESTRPYGNAAPVSADEEQARLEPALRAVADLGTPVSIDTMKARVAAWALDQGAAIVNDVWGLQRDPAMAEVVAARGVPVIIMHNREAVDGSIDIMADIAAFFARSLAIAASAGIPRERIVLDPGIGFGKTPEQSIVTIAHLRDFKRFGLKLLMGLSRKRFIASVVPASPDRRLGGSIAGMLLSVEDGADIVRVHDVAETVQALRVAQAIRSAQ
jgi:dihydropteroate synthase